MNLGLDRIKSRIRRWIVPSAIRHEYPEKFKQLACGIVTTRPDEIDCGECFERLDRFAEIVAAGRSPSRAMPLVQDHLDRCPDCKQEFLALFAVLQVDATGAQRLA
jgi:hypothetical protein